MFGTRNLPISVPDYEATASRSLPRMLSDFVAGGSLSEQTLQSNCRAYESMRLQPRAFAACRSPDLAVEVLGTRLSHPIMTAPTGASGLLWPAGELATARAAHSSGAIMQVSAGSILSMEAIAAAAPGPKWLQIFLYRDRGLTEEFVQRAKAAGYQALMVTTDAPMHGRRERDIRNGFTISGRLTIRQMFDIARHGSWGLRMIGHTPFGLANFEGRVKGNLGDMASYIASVLDPDADWNDFSWLREKWDGPLVVKGILNPEDARIAVERGADAVQVSNHGGRQLDGAIATFDALRGICDAVASKIPVMLDGGIRRGTDILKAIAVGASACAIGRAHLWGLAVAGEYGVRGVIQTLEEEMKNSMVIGGWKSLAELDRTSLIPNPYGISSSPR